MHVALLRKILLPLIPFLLIIITPLSNAVYGQTNFQHSFYLEDSLDQTPLGFALMQFTKISDPVHKTHQLRANSKGIIELVGVLGNDSITYSISLAGYQPFYGSSLVKNLYLKHILVNAETHELQELTVRSSSKKVRYKPGEMQISWNKFSKSPSEAIGSVIKRIPGILNKSLDKNTISLQTSGGKQVSVFLDGRRLSDQEVQSLPATLIAKASLVTFPSALDASENTAVLYLSSRIFAYNYSYDDVSLNYDFGRTGPSFTLRHTQKKGLWGNNIMVNGYHYSMPRTQTDIDIDQAPYQRDSTLSSVNSLILMASLTKKSVKNNLLTIGVYGNLYKGNADGYHFDNSNNMHQVAFNSHSKSTLINATLYGAWHYKTDKGNTWNLHTSGTFQPNSKLDYLASGAANIQSSTNTKNQTFTLGAKYGRKKSTLGKFDWNSSFSVGAKSQNTQIDLLFNQAVSGATAVEKSQQYAIYGGLASALTSEKWKMEGSITGNYGWQKGYDFTHYNNGYIYPKLVFSYAPDDRQSVSLSLSANTLRPSLKMAVTDSNYTSNWMISKGNQAIRAEHDYHLDLLYNLSIGNFSFEAEGEQRYYNNGIVQAWELIRSPQIQLISTYHNIDYYDRSLSLMGSYSFGSALYFKWSGKVHHLTFREPDLPDDYKDGYYLASNLNINYYSHHQGNFALIGSWDGNPLIYLKKTRTRPVVSFSYDYDLSKTVNIFAGLYDIFSSGNWKRTRIHGGLDQLTFAHSRTLSLGLTWKFGQMFAAPEAGSVNSTVIPNDTKRL